MMTSFIMQIIAFIKSNVKYNNLFGSGEFGYSGYVKGFIGLLSSKILRKPLPLWSR